MAKKDEHAAEGELIDLRAALQATLVQQRFTDQAVLMLRGAVEAEGRLRSAEQRAGQLETRAVELERELPTLAKRVTDARAAAAHAEATARESYAAEVAKVRAEIDRLELGLAEMRHRAEAEKRELEAAYQARLKELVDQTADAERRLNKISEEMAAIVARHAPRG